MLPRQVSIAGPVMVHAHNTRTDEVHALCDAIIPRFLERDWGEVCEESWETNDESDHYLLGVYPVPEELQDLLGPEVWIEGYLDMPFVDFAVLHPGDH